jgi:putative spermidine/putrescine transport system ATP-binding protein
MASLQRGATAARLPFERRRDVSEPADTGAAKAGVRSASLGVSLHDVRKNYGGFVALDGVSLNVAAGEFLTLLGPSGSGKTTLLNIIAGFVRLDHGAIRFDDEDVTLRPVNERGLGMVFQNYALFPHMSVQENVAFPLKVRRLGGAEIRERVRSVLSLVQLDALALRNVAALSGGQRQRVALARAVVFSPKIVLMDEPLSALDKNLREQMQVEIRHLHEKIGATTIYVTHDQREALTMSDRVAVMNNGRILQCDTPANVYERPLTAFVANFIGETTLVPVKPCAGGVALADGSVLLVAGQVPATGDLQIAIRSERVLMADEFGPETSSFPALTREVIYQGDSLLILASIAGGHVLSIRRPLRATMRAALPSAGESITVGLDPGGIVVVSRG